MTTQRKLSDTDKRVAKEINLKEIFTVIKRRFWIIVIFTILSGVAGAAFNSLNTTLFYQSSVRIIIGADPELMKTLHVIIKDSTVMEKVIKELNLETTPEALATRITVESLEKSQVVSITVIDSDPERAAYIANTTAKVFKEEVPKIIEFNNVRDLSAAKVNYFPINPKDNSKITLGLIAGLVLGVGFIFLLDSLDDGIRSEHEIEELLGIPVLGRVSKMSKKNIKKKGQYRLELDIRGETSVSK